MAPPPVAPGRRWAPVAATAAGAVGLSGVVVLANGWSGPEWLFLSALLLALALVVRATIVAGRSARAMRSRADDLAATDAGDVARAAVREERRRLGQDISARLGEALDAIVHEAALARSAPDPRPALSRIRHATTEATSDLRRQLGLLHEMDPPETEVAHPLEASASGANAGRGSVRRGDVALAAVATALAAAETTWSPFVSGSATRWATVAITAAAAATVIARRTAPVPAALAAGTLWAAGVLAGIPVHGGLWCLASPCVLLWVLLGSPGLDRAAAGAVAALAATMVWGTWVDDPDNVPMMVVVVLTSVIGGSVAGWWRRREVHAGSAVDERTALLGVVTRHAVEGERRSFARELHDVVSHAIGVIAMQAAAAEVSWPRDPRAVAAALDVVETSAQVARAELGALPGDSRTRTADDVRALAERIRAGGTGVDLAVAGPLPAEVADVVYRVVQESLTNVVRHGYGARADVRISEADGPAGREVHVEVVDDGPGAGPDAARGYGLVGMAERVRRAGGSVTIGAGPDGTGFAVRATLPSAVEVTR